MFLRTVLIAVAFTGFLLTAFAQQQENLTITTYYPSPYGSYNELTIANRMAVGDVNRDGAVDQLDLAASGHDLNNPAAIPESLAVAGFIGIGKYTASPSHAIRYSTVQDNRGIGLHVRNKNIIVDDIYLQNPKSGSSAYWVSSPRPSYLNYEYAQTGWVEIPNSQGYFFCGLTGVDIDSVNPAPGGGYKCEVRWNNSNNKWEARAPNTSGEVACKATCVKW
jgi:hypothetical protein